MNDYQAIYDAVRSRIGNCNIADAVADVARSAFDLSYVQPHAIEAIGITQAEMCRPSVLFRPELSVDGNQWCAHYGRDLQQGVQGFGDTADAAMRAFDANWVRQRTPGRKD